MVECTSSQRKNINREWESLYLSLVNYITCSLKCDAPLEKEIFGLTEEEGYCCLGRSSYCFGITSCGDTILEEVEGFSPFMVSPPKIFLSLVSCDVLM